LGNKCFSMKTHSFSLIKTFLQNNK
jgi:hypothetical protein